MKAIETQYKGYRFRSRLEARWAIFFDCMGIQWEYELEGFDLDGIYYLPDFWLPQVNMWAEVKPGEFTQPELKKVKLLAKQSKKPVLMLEGPPDFVNYDAYQIDPWDNDLIAYDYSLVSRYVETEHRFPCMNYATPDNPNMYGWDYADAIEYARSARFEHGEKPWTALLLPT